ncbi:hypothetical protein [Micromonospora sp. NPDC003816]|uniref:hypothetical protein n=1 Tax=Micromonospora sp. NPDC003816 TaxID=3364224 RepID=UPI0036CADCF0
MAAQGVVPGGDPGKLDRDNRPTGVLAGVLLRLILDHNPATDEPDILQVGRNLTGTPDGDELAFWLNELGYVRLQALLSRLWEHLLVLITRPGASGLMLRLERREANGTRTYIGGIDPLARWITSLQPWTPITAIDPGATGRYSMTVTAGVAPLSACWDADATARLQGRVYVPAGSVAGDTLFTLPSGFAPVTHNRLLPIPTNTGIAAPCEILTSGAVVIRRTQAGEMHLSFDDQTFKRVTT